MAQDRPDDELALESSMSFDYNQTMPHVAHSTSFVEISRIPKKITPKAIVSMVVAGSKIVPKRAEICVSKELDDDVAMIEFKSPIEAHLAVAKLRNSPFGQKWNMKFKDPKYVDPDQEAIAKWLR